MRVVTEPLRERVCLWEMMLLTSLGNLLMFELFLMRGRSLLIGVLDLFIIS